MAKGTRKGGKKVDGTALKNSNEVHNSNNTDESKTQSSKGPRLRNKKQLIQEEESTKVQNNVEESRPELEAKKESSHQHSKIQPTTEQLMIAQIINGADSASDDPSQRKKIERVMDITGKIEDDVATALFDAGWDENKAIDLLLEGSGMGAWEETGKKKKKNKQQAEENKDDWDDSEAVQDSNREKSRQRGPPRMRRGGGRDGDKGSQRNREHNENERNAKRTERSGGDNDFGGRGGQPRRGDQPPRRGRGGMAIGGGPRTFQNRQTQDPNAPAPAGFPGAIDTWTPPGQTASKANAKDAFENAGNWGDDFPAAEDWDNEEYTGSLDKTTVFTASNARSQQPVGGPKNNRSFSSALESNNAAQPASKTQSSLSVEASYSQSVDLSTLLQKPTTQSSISTSQSLLQFQQQATGSLKAVVGIKTTTSASELNYPSYSSQASADRSTYGGSANAGAPPGSAGYSASQSAFTSIKPGSTTAAANGTDALPQRSGPKSSGRSRMPPPSKIPSSAVEMPGDSLTRLDVQFGGLDLQFGGSNNAGGNNSEFEFNGDDSSKYLGDKAKGGLESYVTAAAPSAKEVNKTLSNALSATGSKLGPSDFPASTAADRKPSGSSSYSSSRSPAAGPLDIKGDMSAGGYSAAGSYNSYQNQTGKPTAAQYNTSNYNQSASSQGQFPNSQYSNQSSMPSSTSTQSVYPTAASANYSTYSGSSNAGYPSSYTTSAQAGYKSSANQYTDPLKYSEQNPAGQTSVSAPSVGSLTSTHTTNALSGKVSATSASKVNIPNLPPGVANMIPPQYMIGNTAAAGLQAFYGLQQPMYSYGGIEDLAALQRNAGLHTLVGSGAGAPTVPQPGSGGKAPTTGYYDPSSQFAAAAATTLAAAAANSRDATAAALNSFGSAADKNFGGVTADSTSSPIPSTLASAAPSAAAAAAAAAAAQQPFNLSTFAQHHQAAATLPPGYAYFYPGIQQTCGAATGVYPATAMAVPTAAGGTTTSQFQKSAYGSSYGTGYDSLGQQGGKDFTSSYNSGAGSGMGGKSGGAAAAPGKGGHQYWGGNSALTTGTQLW